MATIPTPEEVVEAARDAACACPVERAADRDGVIVGRFVCGYGAFGGGGFEYHLDYHLARLVEGERTRLRERIQQLREALRGLRRGHDPNGDCYCEVAIGNPMYGGKHTEKCKAARAALQEVDGDVA